PAIRRARTWLAPPWNEAALISASDDPRSLSRLSSVAGNVIVSGTPSCVTALTALTIAEGAPHRRRQMGRVVDGLARADKLLQGAAKRFQGTGSRWRRANGCRDDRPGIACCTHTERLGCRDIIIFR